MYMYMYIHFYYPKNKLGIIIVKLFTDVVPIVFAFSHGRNAPMNEYWCQESSAHMRQQKFCMCPPVRTQVKLLQVLTIDLLSGVGKCYTG